MTLSTSPLYCANHPAVETTLRCNKCEKPICPKCAVRTPTGYRCKECVRGQLKVYDTAQWYDYLLAFGLAVIGSFITSLLVRAISMFFFGFFVLLVAPGAGVAIGEAVRFVTRRHRSPAMFKTALAGMIVGGLPMLLIIGIPVIALLFTGGFNTIFAFLPLIWQGVYLFMATPAMYTRLSGLRLS